MTADNFCVAQDNKRDLIYEINNLLNDNRTETGDYYIVKMEDDKLIFCGYDKSSNHTSKTEAYLSDLTKLAKGLDFSKVRLYCDGEYLCVKSLTTVSCNMYFPKIYANTIYDSRVHPTYEKGMTVYFMPDSRVANRLLELFDKLITVHKSK
jgi:hypothetical protein